MVDDPDEIRISKLKIGSDELVVVSVPRPSPQEIDTLTEAEAEVAELALRGLSNREIADARGTSERTVANQLASVYRKLDVHSRAELAARLTES